MLSPFRYMKEVIHHVFSNCRKTKCIKSNRRSDWSTGTRMVEGVGDGRQGDGGTGVAASSLLNRVGRQDLGHVDGALVQLGLLEFGHGLLSFQLVGPRIRLVPGA